MDTSTILEILRAERDQIDFAIAALEALGGDASAVKSSAKAAQVKAAPTPKKRVISVASRKKMAETAKQRWAAKKAAEKKPAAKVPAVKKVAKKAAAKTAKKRVVSPEARQKMAEAQQKRWAKKKRAVKALGGHPKPATKGHFKTGHARGPRQKL